jgi:hypothetical protein
MLDLKQVSHGHGEQRSPLGEQPVGPLQTRRQPCAASTFAVRAFDKGRHGLIRRGRKRSFLLCSPRCHSLLFQNQRVFSKWFFDKPPTCVRNDNAIGTSRARMIFRRISGRDNLFSFLTFYGLSEMTAIYFSEFPENKYLRKLRIWYCSCFMHARLRQEADPLRAKLEEELAQADAAQTELCERIERERREVRQRVELVYEI